MRPQRTRLHDKLIGIVLISMFVFLLVPAGTVLGQDEEWPDFSPINDCPCEELEDMFESQISRSDTWVGEDWFWNETSDIHIERSVSLHCAWEGNVHLFIHYIRPGEAARATEYEIENMEKVAAEYDPGRLDQQMEEAPGRFYIYSLFMPDRYETNGIRLYNDRYVIRVQFEGTEFADFDHLKGVARIFENHAIRIIEGGPIEEEYLESPDGMLPPPKRGEHRAGFIELALGSAEIQRAPSEEWIPASAGMILFTGDRIRTLENGRLEMVSDQPEFQRIIKIESGSVLNIHGAMVSHNPSILEMIWGKIYYLQHGQFPPDHPEEQFTFGNTLVTVKGTEFEAITEEDGPTILSVIDGTVEVSDVNRSRTVTVNAGETTISDADGIPSDPEPFDTDAMDRWWERYDEADDAVSDEEADSDTESDSGGGINILLIIVPVIVIIAVAIAAFFIVKRKRTDEAPVFVSIGSLNEEEEKEVAVEKEETVAPSSPSQVFCANCGKPNDKGATFCKTCGSKLWI